MARQRDTNPPEKTFRIGNVSASVFVNNGSEDREFRSVNVQRSYMDGDKRKYVSSFGLADLPNAIRALQLAQSFVENQEAAVET